MVLEKHREFKTVKPWRRVCVFLVSIDFLQGSWGESGNCHRHDVLIDFQRMGRDLSS